MQNDVLMHRINPFNQTIEQEVPCLDMNKTTNGGNASHD
jgi:hypothetical protein